THVVHVRVPDQEGGEVEDEEERRRQRFLNRSGRSDRDKGREGEECKPRRGIRRIEDLAEDVAVRAQDYDDDGEDREQVGRGFEPANGQSPERRGEKAGK